ncbi:hypothetical protein ACS15_2774 [Ralstonia insidiosa]|uniref:Uncharacterized protein n=1 Tax=Ralstonia insidiosa TaxID=190721 RepID=A0AAC9BH39_9RALS|nr:hypothetical protein ACS15_2774 [Ralstonia insidiosa]
MSGWTVGVDSTACCPGLAEPARCNELVILAGCDDTLTVHRTNFASLNSYIRHKS